MPNPNELITDIRLLVRKDNAPGEGLEPHEVEQLGEKFIALDNWLSSGGYLPEDWIGAVGLQSTRKQPEMRDYLTQTGTKVQVILLPGGAAVVTWRPGTDSEWTSHETERWVDNEAKHGWLIRVAAHASAD